MANSSVSPARRKVKSSRSRSARKDFFDKICCADVITLYVAQRGGGGGAPARSGPSGGGGGGGASKFCSSCGTGLPATANFCTSCGTPCVQAPPRKQYCPKYVLFLNL